MDNFSRKIDCWIDCDPGIDDAFAIILAYFSDNINIVGISTASGNQTINKTSKNALHVLNICGLVRPLDSTPDIFTLYNHKQHGLEVPVIRGCEKPLMADIVLADEIHGDSGMEATLPPLPQNALKYINNLASTGDHFTTQMYKFLKQSPEKITILETGPLTNIAMLLINHPDAVNYIKEIIFMGGSFGRGNIKPTAEFNIYADAEAASIVLQSSIPLFMVPLDVTNLAEATDEAKATIKSLDTPLSRILLEMLDFLAKTHRQYEFYPIPPLHDPCASLFLVERSLFKYKLMRVDIETTKSLCYGQTVCDFFNSITDKKKNVHVCYDMDKDKFWEHMIKTIKRAGENSQQRGFPIYN